MRSQLDSEALIAAYHLGASASSLARQHNCSLWRILHHLRSNGVEIRTSKEQNTRVLNTSSTTHFSFEDLTTGLLLGDACIDPKGSLHLEQCDARLGWVEQVAEHLQIVGASSKTISIPPKTRVIEGRLVRSTAAHVLYTPAYVEMQAQRTRWYPENKKIVPRDIKLSPIALAHWFCGDGTSSDQGDLRICTNGFTEADTQFLVQKLLSDLQITARAVATQRKGQFTIVITQRKEAHRVLQMIEHLIPECCQYKLRHVRPAKKERIMGNNTAIF